MALIMYMFIGIIAFLGVIGMISWLLFGIVVWDDDWLGIAIDHQHSWLGLAIGYGGLHKYRRSVMSNALLIGNPACFHFQDGVLTIGTIEYL